MGLGVDHKTIRNWLGVLEASYVLTRLPPYYCRFRKRIIKTPKLYFFDTGLACHLLGIQSPDQLDTHPQRGALFENWVFAELFKSIKNKALAAHIYFWRTHGGQEVDFIIEHGQRIDGIEVKGGMTVHPSMLRALNNTASGWEGGNMRTWAVSSRQSRLFNHRYPIFEACLLLLVEFLTMKIRPRCFPVFKIGRYLV